MSSSSGPSAKVIVIGNEMMSYWLWKVYGKDLRSRAMARGLSPCVLSCALTPQRHFMAAAAAYRNELLQVRFIFLFIRLIV